jgi:HD-like signal output (HDOD) protein
MAGAIAETTQAPDKHIVFTAALLKDIGVIVLDRHMGQAREMVRRAMEFEGLDLIAAERQLLGIDHARLGGQIASRWNFSEGLAGAIGNHHLADEEKGVTKATAMVYLADSMCSISGINAELFCGHYSQYDRVRDQLDLSEAQINRIMSDFFSRKEDIYGLLAIL